VPPIAGDLTPPIGRTWNLALVARDPRRQALAIELIKYLSRADNAAAWTQAAHILPASAAALTLWGPDEEYAAFVRGELNRAVPPPSPAALDAVSPAFLSAIREVLIGRATPETAAQAAVEAVARGEK
jgi:ABC-type glycerol-3-phosphate transport system substrate-binding protein